jgi:NAD-dependent SIR2 family protein deacetylase
MIRTAKSWPKITDKGPFMEDTFAEKIHHFSDWLDASESVLIGAGAGLSADAGIDYTDEVSFARNYPELRKLGYRNKLMMMGVTDLAQELLMGYYLSHAAEVRFGPVDMPIYKTLLRLVDKKDTFVLTTNVDGLFVRHGFPVERTFTPQGDYAFYQCLTPCSQAIYPLEPVFEEYLPLIDKQTGSLPKGRYPVCPRCGGNIFLNVRGGEWFVERPWMEGAERLNRWIRNLASKKLLIIDIGSGFNTPMWVRWPCEQLAKQKQGAHLVRINLDHPEVPPYLQGRSLSFQTKASEVLQALPNPKQPGGLAGRS